MRGNEKREVWEVNYDVSDDNELVCWTNFSTSKVVIEILQRFDVFFVEIESRLNIKICLIKTP